MLRFSACACGIIIVFIVLSGCRGATPTLPPEKPNTAEQVGGVEDTRVLWGAYTINMKPGNVDATVQPVSRELLVHFDVTGWVTPPACNDCLKVQLIGWQPQDEFIDVMVTIKNPMELTGYDVRAVVQDYDLKEFINLEGYTDRWSDVEREPFYCFAIQNPDRMFGPFETYCRHVAIHFPPGRPGMRRY